MNSKQLRNSFHDLISGQLNFPYPYVTDAVFCAEIVLKMLTATRNTGQLLVAHNHLGIVPTFTKFLLSGAERLDTCRTWQAKNTVLDYIARAAFGTLILKV